MRKENKEKLSLLFMVLILYTIYRVNLFILETLLSSLVLINTSVRIKDDGLMLDMVYILLSEVWKGTA